MINISNFITASKCGNKINSSLKSSLGILCNISLQKLWNVHTFARSPNSPFNFLAKLFINVKARQSPDFVFNTSLKEKVFPVPGPETITFLG